MLESTLCYGDNLDILREHIPEEPAAGPRSGQAPINITLAQAQRVKGQGDQGKLL